MSVILIAMRGGSQDVEAWGIIPTFLDLTDPRPAKEQIDANFIGGWSHMEGFAFDPESMVLQYGRGDDSDPPMEPLGALFFRDETLLLYDGSWVLILQSDKSWTVSRLD